MRQYGKRIPGAAIVIVTDKQNKPVTPVAGFSQAVRAKAVPGNRKGMDKIYGKTL